MRVVGDEVPTTVALTCRSCRQTYAQHQRLLEYQNEHGRQQGRPIAACRVVECHIVHLQRLRGYGLILSRIVSADLRSQFLAHLLRHHHRRLVDGFVGHHEGHIGIDTHSGLLHAVQTLIEV